jgi:signal transduction histidine kinase
MLVWAIRGASTAPSSTPARANPSVGSVVLGTNAVDPQGPRVQMEGVVTFADSSRSNLVVQEGTRATKLLANLQLFPVQLGQRIQLEAINVTNKVGELSGVADIERNALYFLTGLKVLGSGTLPEPQWIGLEQILPAAAAYRWSEVEGTVTFVGEQGPGLLIEITSSGNRMRLEIVDGSGCSRILLLNSRVRVRGACQGVFNFKEETIAGLLLVPSMKEITVLQPAKNLWRDHPTVPIAQVAQASSNSRIETVVHLRGVVKTAAQNQQGMVEDETGQIQVFFAQPLPVEGTHPVEVLGRATRLGTNWVIVGGMYREIQAAATAKMQPETLPTLTTSEEIQNLKTAEANRNYPVRVRGVITCRISTGGDLQDGTRGIFFYLPTKLASLEGPPHVGDYCEIQGICKPGAFAPVIVCSNWTVLGKAQLPEPLNPTWDQLMNGSLDAQYVEVTGVVRQTTNTSLFVSMRGGVVECVVQRDTSDLKLFEDAVVRVRGCVYPLFNKQRQVIRGRVYAPSLSFVTLEKPAPKDPFTVPQKQAAELRQFDPQAASWSRVKVAGIITHCRDGTYFMMEGTNGLRFVPKDRIRLELGDQVEVSGFPEITGASPVLGDALVRKLGRTPLPTPMRLTLDSLLTGEYDSTLVQVEARLLKVSTNQTDQMFELQMGQRVVLARLNTNLGIVESLQLGSRLELTGVCAGQVNNQSTNRSLESFDLLLNSPSGIRVLERPSWWTIRRTLALVGALAAVLLAALAWIAMLRRRVEERTLRLKEEIDEHKQTEAKLESEIEERKRMELEVEKTHKQLLLASRQAGMAEVATNVLHNVGNVLNSVNIAANMAVDRIRQLKIPSLAKLAALMTEHAQDPSFLTTHEKGKQIPNFLKQLSDNLKGGQDYSLAELRSLQENIDHIKEIVAMQQTYSRLAGLTESVRVSEMVDDALRLNTGALTRHEVKLVKDYQEEAVVMIEKHKVLQILVNLIRNAKYACDDSGRPDKQLTIRIRRVGAERVQIQVIDNGIGIAPENMTNIFNQGFTTRKEGQGFGLHSSANAAHELGGSLTVQSDGLGKGTTFVLEIPLSPPAKASPISRGA